MISLMGRHAERRQGHREWIYTATTRAADEIAIFLVI